MAVDPFTPDEREHDKQTVALHLAALLKAKPYFNVPDPAGMAERYVQVIEDDIEKMTPEQMWRVYMTALMALADAADPR